MDHDFVPTTYVVPSYCQQCKGLLKGLLQQGQRCRRCKQDFHFDCNQLKCEKIEKTDVEPLEDGKQVPSIATPSPEKQEQSEKLISLSPLAAGRKSPSLIDQFVSSVGATRKAMQREWSDLNKPLDLRGTMPKNTVEFLMKVGAMCDAQDGLVHLLMWQQPSRTILAWIAWNVFCFNPNLIVIVPFVVMLFLIYSFIPHETPTETARAPLVKTSSGWSSYLQTALVAASTGIDHVEASKLVNNVDYQKNLQFLQNVQGQYCKVHDNILAAMQYVNWTDPHTTKLIGATCALAIPVLLFVFHRITSLGTFVWIAGNLVFIGNTAFGRTILTDALPILSRTAMDALGVAKPTGTGITKIKSWSKGGNETVVQVWENQRWWAGLGFIGSLLRTDGFPWSDIDRTIQRPSKDDMELPVEAGYRYEWVDPEWKVDLEWKVGDVQALSVNGEDAIGGWIYMDNAWDHADTKQGWFTVTRRRLWTRRMTRSIEEKKDQ
jgi:hypothetical protein